MLADTSSSQISCFNLLLNSVNTNAARISSIKFSIKGKISKIHFKEDERPTIRGNQNILFLNLHLKVFLVASLIVRTSREAESVVVPNASATSKTGNFPTAIGKKAKLLVRAMFPDP